MGMRIGWKLVFFLALLLLAAWSLVSVLGSMGVLPVSAPEEAEGYLLREYEGYLAVYYPASSDYPAMITEVRTRDLPLPDRAALQEGIPAADRNEVMRLLEDFAA